MRYSSLEETFEAVDAAEVDSATVSRAQLEEWVKERSLESTYVVSLISYVDCELKMKTTYATGWKEAMLNTFFTHEEDKELLEGCSTLGELQDKCNDGDFTVNFIKL